MALRIAPRIGKLLYGAVFTVLLPPALAAWAWGAEANVRLPAVTSVPLGAAIAAAGAALWIAGILALRVEGGGLPMNAYPPPRLVTHGIYAVVPHPVYTGFTLLIAGLFLACGSAAGQWLVSPLVALAAAALWWGYERTDLRSRLGIPRRAPWLGVPYASAEPPRMAERLGSVVMVLAAPALCALMLNGAQLAGDPVCLSVEGRMRALAALAPVLGAVFAARACSELRHVVLSSWFGSLVLALVSLSFSLNRSDGRLPVAPDGALVSMIAMVGIATLLGRARRIHPVFRSAAALSAGMLLPGRGIHPSAESLLGAAAFALSTARWPLWRAALRSCEMVANCWRERDLGAVRIIHIGWFGALPAFAGTAAIVVLLGPGSGAMILSAFLFMLAGAALWAQAVEGSLPVSRPFGFFGAIGAIVLFAVALAPTVFNVSPWLVPAAFAVVAPWAQAAARLRCFANGCCHGAQCAPSCGVVYRNPHTRVVRIARLGGMPIHPTQLYSMTGNFLIGILLARLWAGGASLSLITGLYLALTGLARFVEEAWRGEPQTPSYAGLRLYQWLSAAAFAAGAALTAVPETAAAPCPEPCGAAIWTGVVAGALTWFALSVDFPRSRKRFSRLA